MRSSFPTLALLATLSLGLGLGVQTVSSSAMGASGAARAAVSADATQSPAELAGYRDRDRRQWHRYRDRDGRDWRRSHRHRDWSPPRHYRPHTGFYFHFGTPAPRYVPAPRRHYGLSRAHVNWCHARYRSYRAWDNTFQPHYGPRRHCISPYV